MSYHLAERRRLIGTEGFRYTVADIFCWHAARRLIKILFCAFRYTAWRLIAASIALQQMTDVLTPSHDFLQFIASAACAINKIDTVVDGSIGSCAAYLPIVRCMQF